MTATVRLHATLESLGVSAIETKLDGLLERASKSEASYAEFLADVLGAEADTRRQRYLKTRLQSAHLPYVKTFEQFDSGFQASIDERHVRELRTLRILHEASNVVLLGPPGLGRRIWRWHWLRQ